jgi:hypothetical protein
VARKRFARLGWKNVKVICQDARKFRLEDYESDLQGGSTPGRTPSSYFTQKRPEHGGADLITMSYSLSMIVRSTPRSGPPAPRRGILNKQLTKLVVAGLLLCG